MMVAVSMHSLELRFISSKETIPQPNLQGFFHGKRWLRRTMQFSREVSARGNINNLYNNCSFPVRRKGFCKILTPIPKGIIPFCTVSSSLSSIGNSEKRSNNKSEDYISRLLREKPSPVEPRFLIGDKLYTQSERDENISLFVKRFSKAINEIFSKIAMKAKIEEKKGGFRADTDKEASPSPVYLKDLLRQYKGELYVPEEAFDFKTSEMVEFNRILKTLPQMCLTDFLNLMRENQIEMLTSRAYKTIVGNYTYRDFIVDLKEIPGVMGSQTKKWAMHLSDEEAQAVLGEYSGPQREFARRLTSYVVTPCAMPHPVAYAIASRVWIELGMLTKVIATVVATVALIVGVPILSLALMVIMTVAVVLSTIMLPPVYSLVLFLADLLPNLVRRCAPVPFHIFHILIGGLQRLYAIMNYFFTSDFKAVLQTGGIIVFVVACMTALIRFTLIRKPKNMRHWDIWTALEFAQSKPQARVEGTTGVKFSDVAGIDYAVSELQELVNYLKNPELFDKTGLKAPHGVLLEGPPGCGKTLLAKAIAGEAGVPFYEMAGSEFTEVLVGVGAARVRDLFKRAKVNKPSVVFVDEIDALGVSRQGEQEQNSRNTYDANTMERETTLNQLLIELDGFDTGKGVIFLGATNRKDLLDPALLRPGRFDRKISITPAGPKGRLDILKVHSKKVKMSPSVDLFVYAKILQGWTGAQLAQLLQEAAVIAIRNGHGSIVQHDMDMAVDRLTVGPERRVKLAYPLRRAASEVGFALTTHLLRHLENACIEYCIRISMVPRDSLSRTLFNRFEDYEAYIFERRPELLHRLQVMLGGRAAEEVMYGRDTSTLSLEYLPDASWLARKIISIWNLENTMTVHAEQTPWTRAPGITGPQIEFEGELYTNYYFHEDSLNYKMDDDINYRAAKLLNDMYRCTVTLLQHHRAALAKTIYVLIEKREISGSDLDLIIDQYPADTPVHLVEGEDDPGSLPPRGGVQQLPREVLDAMRGKTIQEDNISSKTTN